MNWPLPAVAFLARLEQSGRDVQRVRRDHLELGEPPADLDGLDVDVAEAEQVEADVGVVAVEARRGNWHCGGGAQVGACARELDRAGDTKRVEEHVDVEAGDAQRIAVAVECLVGAVKADAVGEVQPGLWLRAGVEPERSRDPVPQVLSAYGGRFERGGAGRHHGDADAARVQHRAWAGVRARAIPAGSTPVALGVLGGIPWRYE